MDLRRSIGILDQFPRITTLEFQGALPTNVFRSVALRVHAKWTFLAHVNRMVVSGCESWLQEIARKLSERNVNGAWKTELFDAAELHRITLGV